jgi:type VI secretion system protein VasD
VSRTRSTVLSLSVLLVFMGLALPGGNASSADADTDTAGTRLELTLVGGPTLNPNTQGHASPVIVRIFDLSSTAAFEKADYAGLFEHPGESLQQDILAQEEVVLRPGDTQEHNRALPPAVKALGVAAAFRDLEHAGWRITVPIKPGKRNFILIDLDQSRIRLDPVE